LQLEDNVDNSEMLTQRLQNNFNRHNAQSDKPYELSISTGFHFMTPPPVSIDELLVQADKEMYEQKS